MRQLTSWITAAPRRARLRSFARSIMVSWRLVPLVHWIWRSRKAQLTTGGVLFAHFPGITRNTVDWGPPGWNGVGDLWRLTAGAASRLCAEEFGADHITIEARGNVRVAAALLYGLAAEDLSGVELELRDPRYDVIVMARAIKPG